MESNKPSVSIIVPVFNEAESIYSFMEKLLRVTSSNNEWSFNIIVVDDGSTDNTLKILKGFAGITLVTHKHNRGYGAAIKTGISNCSHDCIVIIDGDGTYPSDIIPSLIKEIGDADMVVGARIGENAKIPLIRRPAKWVLNVLANYLANCKIPDLNSGLMVMRKNIINLFIDILPDGFSFTTTITLAMLTNGYQIKYIPISYIKRTGKSKINPIPQTLNFMQLIIRTVMYFNPLRVFLPISLILFSISLASLIYRTFHAGGLGVFTMIMFVAAIQFLSAGMIADLIIKRRR